MTKSNPQLSRKSPRKPNDYSAAFIAVFSLVLVFANIFPAQLSAQAPTISYSSPQTYTAGTPITTLVPTTTGVSAPPPVIIGSGFIGPQGVAIDANGNVFVADHDAGAVKEIKAADGSTIIIASGLTPVSVAVDAAGNIYVADYDNSAVKEILVNNTVVTLGSGFNHPSGVAVDASGTYVYVADFSNNVVKKMLVSDGSTVTIGTGISQPRGVALDAAGNVFVADYGDGTLKKILVSNGSTVTLGSGFSVPRGVAVDASGNVYVGDTGNHTVTEIRTTGVVSSATGDYAPYSLAVDAAGVVYIADASNNLVKKLSSVSGYNISPALPAGLAFDYDTGNISGTPTAISPATDYTVTAYNSFGSTPATLNIRIASPSPVISYASPQSYPGGVAITALSPANSGGAVAAPGYSGSPVTLGSGFNDPHGVAIDAAGNVYVADYNNNAVKKIPVGGGSPVTIGSGFITPTGVAVDAAGNVYVADNGNNAVKKIPVGGGSPIILGSGFTGPSGVAVDAAGNVYVSDAGNAAIKKIPVGGGSPITLGTGFNDPAGLAIDGAGNVYVAVYYDNAIKKIPAGGGSAVTVASGFSNPTGVAVDALGNVFVADFSNSAVKEIPLGTGPAITIGSGFNYPIGVGVDGAGNVYVADDLNSAVKEIKPIGGYFINAGLPAGLAFDGSTGIISGLPTVVSPATNYLVTAYNNAGSGSATVNIAVKANADLNSLAISAGTLAPSFAKATTAYTASVGNPVAAITVTPTSSDAAAKIKVNGTAVTSGSASAAIPLNAGPNTITTVVTAQDGITTNTYTVTVTRAPSSDASLAGLAINSGALSPSFAAGTSSYTASVANAVTTVAVTPTANNGSAVITVNGVTVPSGSTSSSLPLSVGPNAITVLVSAQDGITTNTYTITVTRAPSAPTISNTGTLSALNTTYGTASPSASFTVSGVNMTAGILVTPPAGFEVSINNNTFSSTSIVGAAGTIASTPVYVRLAATNTAGTYSGNIVLSSTGAANINVATAGSTVNPAPLTVTPDNKTRIYGAANPVFTASYGGFVNGDTQASLTTLPVIGTTATAASPVGTYPLTAGGAVGPNYAISYLPGTLTVTPATRTIAFNPLPVKTFNDADLDPGATASSGESIIYSSNNPVVATIINGKIHITGAGTATITATVAANSNYTTPPSVNQTFTVNKAHQTIDLANIPTLLKGSQFDLSVVSSSSGLPVNFTVSDASVAVVQGQALKALEIGKTRLTASQPGNTNYFAATNEEEIVTVEDAQGDEILVHQSVSPNGDGINDFLQIEGIKNYPDNSIVIVNRNGVKIFDVYSYNNETRVFDGHSNITGSLQQAGTYFYLVVYRVNGENKHKTGYFVLKYQ